MHYLMSSNNYSHNSSFTFQRVGDKTPADLMIFAATDLKVDNSSLTGESEPQERLPLPEGSKARPVEAENLVDVVVIF
jgi:magnesium-transporting ATPase (P-type)